MVLSLAGMPSDVDAFEFYLADKLGMTVARMLEEMSADEYMH